MGDGGEKNEKKKIMQYMRIILSQDEFFLLDVDLFDHSFSSSELVRRCWRET